MTAASEHIRAEPRPHQDIRDMRALADIFACSMNRPLSLEKAARSVFITTARAKYIWNLILTDLGEQAT